MASFGITSDPRFNKPKFGTFFSITFRVVSWARFLFFPSSSTLIQLSTQRWRCGPEAFLKPPFYDAWSVHRSQIRMP